MSYVTEFMSFPVKPGKEVRAGEWLQCLVERQAECVETLDREAMHFESIFRSEIGGRMHLSWLSVQGSRGAHVNSSTFPVDKLHMEFWAECIDASIPPISYQHIVNFVPAEVAQAIQTRELSLANHAA